MLIYAIIIWVLITLNAPAWTYVFICISTLIKILNAGIKLGKNANQLLWAIAKRKGTRF